MPLKERIRDFMPPVLWRGMSAAKRRMLGLSDDVYVTDSAIEPWQEQDPDPGLLSDDDRRFIETRVPEVPGWLIQDAAYFTAYALNFQHRIGIVGPALEIGVFAGKFLLLLHYLGRRHGSGTVGIDIFSHSRPEPIIGRARGLFGTSEGLVLKELNSAELSPGHALEFLGGVPPRVISIDGDHRAEGVLNDLRLAAAILAERGLVILDDVLNPNAIGVPEGVFRFLLQPGCDLMPFAYVSNKMFVCRREQHDTYLDAGRRFAVNCADLPVAQRFLESRAQAVHRVEQDFLDSKILIYT